MGDRPWELDSTVRGTCRGEAELQGVPTRAELTEPAMDGVPMWLMELGEAELYKEKEEVRLCWGGSMGGLRGVSENVGLRPTGDCNDRLRIVSKSLVENFLCGNVSDGDDCW